MRNTFKLGIVAAAILLIGQGCPIKFGGVSSGNDGGVFLTTDRGAHWAQKSGLLSVAGGRSIASVSVLTFESDPQDARTIYAGTTENGIFYTLDGGESWTQPAQITGGRFQSIAVDAKRKCNVYGVTGNRVVKTDDCARTWYAVFQDSRANVTLTSIAVDHFNPSVIYITSSEGDVIRSQDYGSNWATIKVFEGGAAQKLVIDPFDSRILMVGTRAAGVWRSVNSGAAWVDVSKDLAQFDGARDLYDLVPDRSKKDSYVLVSRFGLTRTEDGGTHWQKVPLLTPPNSARIYALALNPRNGAEMYYATANGGANWTTKKLPTPRAGTALMVAADNANAIYLGGTQLKK